MICVRRQFNDFMNDLVLLVAHQHVFEPDKELFALDVMHGNYASDKMPDEMHKAMGSQPGFFIISMRQALDS